MTRESSVMPSAAGSGSRGGKELTHAAPGRAGTAFLPGSAPGSPGGTLGTVPVQGLALPGCSSRDAAGSPHESISGS